jgi:putative DNA primase/helicase
VVVICEGEKDCDRLWALNIPATTNAGGAGKWRDALNRHFHNTDLVIIPDRDPQAKNREGTLRFHPDGRRVFVGQDHARDVASRLSGVARRSRILEMPAPHKDVSDWFEAGG